MQKMQLNISGKMSHSPTTSRGYLRNYQILKYCRLKEFLTNANVKLRYWEAGFGKSLIIATEWGANGAWQIHNIYLPNKKIMFICSTIETTGCHKRWATVAVCPDSPWISTSSILILMLRSLIS